MANGNEKTMKGVSPSDKSHANKRATGELQELAAKAVTRALMGQPDFYGQIQLTLQFTAGVATAIFTDTRQTHKLPVVKL